MASRGVSHYYSHLLCAQGAGVEDIKGCGASFSPGVQDLIHPHAVNDVCCNAYATIPQHRICYVRYRQALPTQNGRLVHKVFIFANPDCMPSIRQLGLVEVHWCSTLAVLHRIARPKGRPCCGYASTQRGPADPNRRRLPVRAASTQPAMLSKPTSWLTRPGA